MNLTPEEQRLVAETTPEQWAQASAEVVKDRSFWAEIGSAILTGFLEGLTEGT